MNKVILMGNVTSKGVELLFGKQSGKAIAKWSISFKDGDKTQYIQLTAFGKTAEYVAKYFPAGKPMLVDAKLDLNKYEKDGTTKYLTNVIVNNVSFVSRDFSDDK